MFNYFRKELDWGGRKLVLETGKIARQADGAVLVSYGDTIVLCTGQEPNRALADELAERGIEATVIGGADVAAELDAKRAIDQGTRLAAAL